MAPTIDMQATGRNIKAMCKASGMRTDEIMHLFGFTTPQSIYKWYRGASIPSIDNLLILSDVLKTKIDEIIVRRS